MAAAITYEGEVRRSESGNGGLFVGQKLWFSHSVPQRQWLIQNAELNGAQIVPLEQQADIKLVDHKRKNQAPGTHSYQYIERSIRNGQLEDLDFHRVGSAARASRPVGSVVTAPKGGRNKFTDAEDQLLWDVVKPYMDAGGTWKGNEIYKQIESINANHTFQSWRDRWIKHTQYHNRQTTVQAQANNEEALDAVEESPRAPKRQKVQASHHAEPRRANISVVQTKQAAPSQRLPHALTMGNAESSQANVHSTDETIQHEPSATMNVVSAAEDVNQDIDIGMERNTQHNRLNPTAGPGNRNAEGPYDGNDKDNDDDERKVRADGNKLPLAFNFTQDEARMLYKATCHILDARPEKLDESWAGVAREHGHTKDAWRKFFYKVIVPEYKKRHDIQTEADLEIHYKAQLNEERSRKAREEAEPTAKEKGDISIDQEDSDVEQTPETNGMEVDEGKEPSIQQIDGAEERLRFGKEGSGQDRSAFVLTGQHTRALPTSTVIAEHRSPQPNESRKLSQGKSSQSTSSHAQSLSTTQSSQRSQRLAVIPEVPATITTDRPGERCIQQKAVNEAESETALANYTSHVQQLNPKPTLPTSQRSEEHDEISDRFVTQISNDQQTSSTESNVQLYDIPYREPSPEQQRQRSNSPLFIPESSGNLSPILARYTRRDNESESRSSPPIVQLVDDDEPASEGGPNSEYAPSEAPSEGIHFESEVRLSQAWETAPEQPRLAEADETDIVHNNQDHGLDVDHDATAFDEWRTAAKAKAIKTATHNVEPDRNQVSQAQNEAGSQHVQNTINEFETAPAILPDRDTPEGGEAPGSHTKSNNNDGRKLDTQALFQQHTQVDLAELAAIPEPPDGWDDDVSDVTDVAAEKLVDKHVLPVDDADWTLPLPDPDIDPDDAPSAQPEADTDIGIDQWLADQPISHPDIPQILLKPLSYRALETTSLDLALATTVLARMVQRFEKGKHSAHLSLSDIRKLPKRQRKSAISKIVDELVPTDMGGCWTLEDDTALLGVNGRGIKRVEDKHGRKAVDARFEFLETWHAE